MMKNMSLLLIFASNNEIEQLFRCIFVTFKFITYLPFIFLSDLTRSCVLRISPCLAFLDSSIAICIPDSSTCLFFLFYSNHRLTHIWITPINLTSWLILMALQTTESPRVDSLLFITKSNHVTCIFHNFKLLNNLFV